VRHYIYPALSSPLPALQFDDQFAFRPTGSTTAAIIHLLHTVINLLETEPYVIVMSLDFSRAFDTVRHSTLLHKLSQLHIPDRIYNWLVDFFDNHFHCTVFRDELSTLLAINASIIQGSAIGPAAYVVTAGDLVIAAPGNTMCKYADDTYIIIPASNEMTRHAELTNVQKWAEQNNLKPNCSKSTEVIFRDNRRRRHHTAAALEPAPMPGIARNSFLKMLGINIENNFSIAQHVQHLVAASTQSLYAMRVLRTHGLDDDALQHIFRARLPESLHT